MTLSDSNLYSDLTTRLTPAVLRVPLEEFLRTAGGVQGGMQPKAEQLQ